MIVLVRSNVNRLFVLILVVAFLATGCKRKVYPDEMMKVDSRFWQLFKALTNSDTLAFCSESGRQRKFIVSDIDSFTHNYKTGFIDQEPSTAISANVREVGRDSFYLPCQNGFVVGRLPAQGINKVFIDLDKFSFGDSILPALITDSLKLGKKTYTGYYIFRDTNNQQRKSSIVAIYVRIPEGIIAFEGSDGEFWVRF